MADYITKIRNLLDLAESPEENEARAALLKARELMAKYKISEQNLEDANKQEIVRKLTGITYSERRDPWIAELGHVVAEHHCCKYIASRHKGKQTKETGFIGLADDIAICVEVFKYAVDCVISRTKSLRSTGGPNAANGYGFGFVAGLKDAYDGQREYGLILVVPEIVNDATKGLRKERINRAEKLKESDMKTFRKGFFDGRKFEEQKRITGNG